MFRQVECIGWGLFFLNCFVFFSLAIHNVQSPRLLGAKQLGVSLWWWNSVLLTFILKLQEGSRKENPAKCLNWRETWGKRIVYIDDVYAGWFILALWRRCRAFRLFIKHEGKTKSWRAEALQLHHCLGRYLYHSLLSGLRYCVTLTHGDWTAGRVVLNVFHKPDLTWFR